MQEKLHPVIVFSFSIQVALCFVLPYVWLFCFEHTCLASSCPSTCECHPHHLMEREADDLASLLAKPLAKQAQAAKDPENAAAEKGGNKRKRAETPPPPPAASGAKEQEKKCKSCKKKKPMSSFYQSQANCKDCSHAKKNVQKMAKNQKETAWVNGLSEQQLEELTKLYLKEKEKADKDHVRCNFQIRRRKETVKASSGVRAEGRRRFMNEIAWMKWAQSEEGENYTKKQAEDKWQEMLSDDRVERLGEGKKIRLAVKVFDELVDYSDVGKERSVEQEGRLSNKLTKEQLQQKINSVVLSNHDSGLSIDKAASAQTMANEVLEGGGEACFGSANLPGQTLQGIYEQGQASNKRKRDGEMEEKVVGSDSEGGKSDAEEKAAGSSEKTEKHGRSQEAKWFDAEAEIAKAQRQVNDLKGKFEVRMTTMLNTMAEQMDLSRASGVDMLVEMKIVASRREALNIIHSGDAESFQAYCAKISKSHGQV